MDVKLMKSEAKVSLHLEGNNTIDAVALSEIIKNFAELAKYAAARQDPESYLKMNVTALQNGSFQINFSAIQEFIDNLINNPSEMLSFAGQVISTVKGYFEVKKLLKGKKEKSVVDNCNGTITITAQDGNTATVNKDSISVMDNAQIDNMVVNVTTNIYNHNPRGGFSLSTGEDISVFSNSDVIEMKTTLPIADEEIVKNSRIRADLQISKADILKYSAWTFIYNGKTIKASIIDMDFLEEIHKGSMSIKSGSYITADLLISVRMENGLPINNTAKYTIEKVYGGIKNDFEEQINLLEE